MDDALRQLQRQRYAAALAECERVHTSQECALAAADLAAKVAAHRAATCATNAVATPDDVQLSLALDTRATPDSPA